MGWVEVKLRLENSPSYRSFSKMSVHFQQIFLSSGHKKSAVAVNIKTPLLTFLCHTWLWLIMIPHLPFISHASINHGLFYVLVYFDRLSLFENVPHQTENKSVLTVSHVYCLLTSEKASRYCTHQSIYFIVSSNMSLFISLVIQLLQVFINT